MKISKHVNLTQIRALLQKDFLVRFRQPWMTIVQYVWPCIIFIALYILRNRFQPVEISDCQYPTRQLQANGILPFFQSYICTIENACSDPNKYEEVTSFEAAPVTPVLNIIQIFLNDDKLFNSVIAIPDDKDFITSVTIIATHSKFKEIESNADTLLKSIPEIERVTGEDFNIDKLFADDRVFSNSGNILCGKAFPRSNNIRFVENILYSTDYAGPDQDEIDAMPTDYCKQLYLDVTNSNHGKITWNTIKPIIHGKIIYGPDTDENREIINSANYTFSEINKLREFFQAINTTLKLLKTDPEMKDSFEGIIELIKSPFVQALIGTEVNVTMIEGIMRGILEDVNVAKTIETVVKILGCFSVDRFVPVKTEAELVEKAYELNKKKLFYAGVVFDEKNNTNEVGYKLRMEIDDTPVTAENKNRFWFPGPAASFELDMRYHRGFIEIQHALDVAIIKTNKQKLLENKKLEVDDETELSLSDNFDDDDDDATTTTTEPSKDLDSLFANIGSTLNISQSDLETHSDDSDALKDFLDFKDEDEEDSVATTMEPQLSRKKRSPQFGGFFDMFLGGGSKKKVDVGRVEIGDAKFYTKQFPYPSYVRDDFKKGLYLAQAVQMSFFIALIVNVSSCVRHRIWMKESGNNMLMRAMGLKGSSETISWFITAFIEFAIVFLLGLIILYVGGILSFAGPIFMYFYLLIFGLCTISFCYMCSTFFSSASIGSVSAVILFLTSFLPYVLIVSFGASLGIGTKFVVNLSFSTAFCYAWHYLMRLELQHKSTSFDTAFSGNFVNNDLLFGMFMIVLDMILYAAIGFLYEKYMHEDTRFYKIKRTRLDKNVGAVLKNVNKIYENHQKAVDNVSLTFRKDEVTCLLGRNGAGKSTIIKLLTGQIVPTSGEVNLPLDYDLISGLKNNQEKIGLCSQNDILIPNLTAKEHLKLYARIKMVNGFDLEVQRVMESLNLGKYENYKVSDLSGGFKRRLCIAIAFLGSPNLVILDEPCSSVDTKARKNIWDLIEILRKDRAVVLATHHLEEAEHLSDNVIILGSGKIISELNLDQLRERFTKTFSIKVNMKSATENERMNIVNVIKNNLSDKINSDTQFVDSSLYLTVPYITEDSELVDYEAILKKLENLQDEKRISSFQVVSENLSDLFNSVNKMENLMNGHYDENANENVKENNNMIEGVLCFWQSIGALFLKRLLHFKRNYRLLVCILILPAIFEFIAMGFMKLRPPGGYDNALHFGRNLYPESVEFYAKEGDVSNYEDSVYNYSSESCMDDCLFFNNTEDVHNWLWKSQSEYIEKRYGGITIDKDKNIIWYNNKGYHSMPTYMNILNSAMFKAEMNDSSYNIKTVNHPLKLGGTELSSSSILQQVADAGISLIILIAFSLVLAGGSVYIVNERINGEKLQQNLCGIGIPTYWGVTFIWDYIVYCIALSLAVIVFQICSIPIFTEKDNLDGICLLLFLYGFASIPAVHVFEKLFNDASFANMSIFCMNFIIAMSTITIIVLFDILGNSDQTEKVRNILNRVFLIFPQHALSDGLINICQNHIQAEIFKRYYIDTYRSPLTSSLLKYNYISLVIMGIFFTIVNFLIEHKYIQRFINRFYLKNDNIYELEIISIQNSLKKDKKIDNYAPDQILRVDHLSKMYNRGNIVVNNVSFFVKNGECFGLLGTNGAGKSTIFSILSGELLQTTGNFLLFGNNGLSYCPQTNALDMLLTVEEVIKFYGKLRKVKCLETLTQETLHSYHLEPYKHILVKNLSGGNRRKLSVAVTCFGNTNLILMDEPTSDMDPVTRSIVYKTINKLNRNQRSVLLTSHSISEIDKICQRIAILKDGKLLITGTPEQLKDNFGNSYVITIFTVDLLFESIERVIRENFPTAENLVKHKGSIQFNVKTASSKSQKQNGASTFNLKEQERPLLSDLFKKLHKFSVNYNNQIKYTVSACLLDQAFENILEDECEAYSNTAFTEN